MDDRHAVTCMYCGRQNGPNEGMWIVRQAYKKPYSFNRYMTIGTCCDDCEAAGKPVQIDPWRQARANTQQPT